ncbi:MAG TPA: penicillin-binding transpeptidase domain-containing protein, partial [Candidatus Eisenbacteria bacterium]|nr:penicillin-binding transpeptidase domain-containing protein [Candidatus Eisenbacteria bacterium]
KSDLYDPNYTMLCKGEEALLGPGSVTENRGESSHGELDMKTAFQVSCNHYFGDIAIKASFNSMQETAEEFGFNKELSIGKLYAKTGNYKTLADDNYLLSWQAIGQPIDVNELSVSTLHLAMISGAIANGGVTMQPYLVKSFISPRGDHYDFTESEVYCQVSRQADLETINEDLIATVNNGKSYGSYIEGYRIGGKTGTAESVNDSGELVSNSLYTGFIDNPQYPYAIGIVFEDGWYDTAAIAGQMFYQAIQADLSN